MTNRLALSRATNSIFPVPVPEGLECFGYQKAGVEYATTARNILFADPPGVGKTIQSIGFMNYAKINRVLILCPASLTHNWKRELERWRTEPAAIEIFHPKKFDPRARHEIVIMSYAFAANAEAVKKILAWGKYNLCVLDECQYLKNSQARRTKFVLARNGIVSKAARVHALSGTPIVNRPLEIYPIVARLCPEAIDHMSAFEFGLKYCAGFKSEWGWDFTGASNLAELGQRLRTHFMVRRKKEDVLPQLPRKFPPNLVYLDVDGEAKRLVKRMAAFDAEAVAGKVVSVDFEELSTLRREIGVAKIPAALTYIKTQLDSGHQKIIVFAHHKEVMDGLAAGLLDYGVAMISGDVTSGAKRQEAIDRFQNEKGIRIFLASVTAAGVGITLTAASYVIFSEFSWISGENDQAIDRAHRIGQVNGVVTDYLVYENSLDERMLKLLWKKSQVIAEAME